MPCVCVLLVIVLIRSLVDAIMQQDCIAIATRKLTYFKFQGAH